MTIFVNPLQFGPGEDLDRYPRDLAGDLALLSGPGLLGTGDVVFAPEPATVYPDGDPAVRVHAGPLGDVLEGAGRPGHLDGVLTVVLKLLHLVAPDVALFGRKDAQQVVVILETESGYRPGKAGRPRPAEPPLQEAVRRAVRERCGAEVVAVFTTRALPTDIRHNSKIDRAALSRWSEQTLRGQKADSL